MAGGLLIGLGLPGNNPPLPQPFMYGGFMLPGLMPGFGALGGEGEGKANGEGEGSGEVSGRRKLAGGRGPCSACTPGRRRRPGGLVAWLHRCVQRSLLAVDANRSTAPLVGQDALQPTYGGV